MTIYDEARREVTGLDETKSSRARGNEEFRNSTKENTRCTQGPPGAVLSQHLAAYSAVALTRVSVGNWDARLCRPAGWQSAFLAASERRESEGPNVRQNAGDKAATDQWDRRMNQGFKARVTAPSHPVGEFMAGVGGRV